MSVSLLQSPKVAVLLHNQKSLHQLSTLERTRDGSQSLDQGQEVADGASASQIEERGLDTLEFVVLTVSSEVVNGFLKDLKDLLSERDARDLDDPVVVLGVGVGGFVLFNLLVFVIFFVFVLVFVLVFALILVLVLGVVFLPRRGSRGDSLVADRVGSHANGTQVRVSSRRCGRRSDHRRSGRLSRNAAALDLCGQIPGKDRVHDPQGIVGASARDVVLVVGVAASILLDIISIRSQEFGCTYALAERR